MKEVPLFIEGIPVLIEGIHSVEPYFGFLFIYLYKILNMFVLYFVLLFE